MQCGIATVGDNLAVSYKSKHTWYKYTNNHTPWDVPKGVETYWDKNLYVDVYDSFFYNCQNLEAINMFLSRWMNK